MQTVTQGTTMYTRTFSHRDFADTLFADSPAKEKPQPRRSWGTAWPTLGGDPLAEMQRADASDWTLLRLVLCAAAATLLLALAVALVG